MAIKETISSVSNTLSKTAFDGSVLSIATYADGIYELTTAQRAAALSSAGLSDAQTKVVLSNAEAMHSITQLTIAEFAQKYNTDAVKIANSANAKVTDTMTIAIIKAAMAIGELTEEQLEQVLAAHAVTAANNAAADSTNKLKGGFLAAFKSMGAMDWISLAASAIPLLIQGATWLYDTLVTTSDEYTEMFKEAKSAITATEEEIEGLNQQISDNKERIAELQSLR